MNIEVKNLIGDVLRNIEIPECVFGIDFDAKLVNRVLRYGALSQRSCTASTKNRSAVAGSGKKRRAQKKTGRARMGERNAVHHRGGSVAFGPNGRKYDLDINKKIRRLALKMVLSDKMRFGEFVILDKLAMNESKTKEALKIRDSFDFSGRCLFVDSLDQMGGFCDNSDLEKFWLSIRNIYDMDLETVHTMNIKQIMNCKKVFFTEAALNELLLRFGGNNEEN
jgi:large subunit ribosomal protein L4